ncbi:putative disease resistance protein RGA3 [Jatropha curcas]|uniref:putative disease resistance protein RGA3 n=1 Tax=Jatropha curcas TaxID=180498 RepID=UPI001895FD65|nr:putative disease resistance protein RGA3 [Jatropha curcas]
MALKVKKIRSKLDEIAENRKFHLNNEHRERMDDMTNYEEIGQSHSSLPGVVIGRKRDKKAIMKFLLSSNCEENVSVVSIVGIGGLGKTTLAQLVFNDETVESQFDLKIWVCISYNFDVKAILEKILESITREKPARNCEMNTLKNLLHEKINGKRYLLVLDDVWHVLDDVWHYEEWFLLKDLLDVSASGSKIIVTTRLKIVAERIISDSIYELQGLSKQDSWSLFVQMAFRQGRVGSQEHELVGKEIVAKFVGVPLAIRAIGRLLYFKNTISEWLSFKDKELVNINKEDASILPTLMLSYNHLPSHFICPTFFKTFALLTVVVSKRH